MLSALIDSRLIGVRFTKQRWLQDECDKSVAGLVATKKNDFDSKRGRDRRRTFFPYQHDSET